MNAAVSVVAGQFAPTLVSAEAILRNGPTLDDLVRLSGDLDRFGSDLLLAAADELPEPLVDALVNAMGAVGAALNSAA